MEWGVEIIVRVIDGKRKERDWVQKDCWGEYWVRDSWRFGEGGEK